MKCRKCGAKTSVIDSRPTKDGSSKRRRRECTTCHDRATTMEKYVEVEFKVIDDNGLESEFEIDRLQAAIALCMRISPLNFRVDGIVESVAKSIKETHEFSVSTKFIRESALAVLSGADRIRYLSMFCDIENDRYLKMMREELRNVQQAITRRN